MSNSLSIDPTGKAEKLAMYDIENLQVQLKKQQKLLAAQQGALKSLKSSLTGFRSTLTGLNKLNDGVLQNSAKMSAEGIADIKASSNATKGSYSFFVEQLASAHQLALENITDESLAADQNGSLTIEIGDKKIDIDLKEINSMAELAEAINSDADNPGTTASVIRTDGKLVLMLSSNETGIANKMTLTKTGTALGGASELTIAEAKDLKVRLGDKSAGLLVTRGSNSVDDLIAGVKIEFKQAHKADDAGLKVDINPDTTVTKAQVNKFIDQYNSLLDAIDSLTKRGAAGSNDKGAFAGDSSIIALKSQLNNEIRQVFGDHHLTDFGITADRQGHLKLESKDIDELLKKNPNALTEMFNGDKGLLKTLDKSLDSYLSSTNGQIKLRQDTLDRKEAQLKDRSELINVRYTNAYNRYLKQFSSLQKVMAGMENTMNMFNSLNTDK